MRTPRIAEMLNEYINVKGEIMDAVRKRYLRMTLQEALPHLNWFRHRHDIYREYLETARQQAKVLQKIIEGVPCFYVKESQGEVNYHPIRKYVWDDKEEGYVCHTRRYHYENHQKVWEWIRGGKVEIDYLIRILNQWIYLASLTPMTNSHQYNLE